MPDDLEKEIKQLENRAEAIQKNLLQFASRAFVIEFAGTPKSGKSTSVEAIRHLFVRNGFRVHVLIERASVCPIPMKGHLFFNTWCASTMLADLVENVDTDTDLIILDRGLFDALVWMALQEQRGELTYDEARAIESFMLLDRWRMLIDLAVVMNVSADEAITREQRQRISNKLGSIMNPEVLGAMSKAVAAAIEHYGPKFRSVIEFETSGRDVKQSNTWLANQILDRLTHFLDPEIFVVPRSELSRLPLKKGGAFSEPARKELVDCLSRFGRPMQRSQAEVDPDHVQIIACGILAHKNRVFLFERKERDPKYRLYGKTTIWQGTHVAVQSEKRGIELLRSALHDRITHSLFLSRNFPAEFVGYCWDPNDAKSSLHFGVMFRVTIDNEHTAADLKKKEFRRGRGPGLAGGFVEWAALTSKDLQDNLESWSISILSNLKDIQGLKEIV